jgi:hypothetical protein
MNLVLVALSPCHASLLAYGPMPGMEFIPYFLAMVAWVVLAIFGIFFSPITSLFRRLRRGKRTAQPDGKVDPATVPPQPPSTGGLAGV